MWNTSYKTKSEDFRKIFKDVYREDRLLVGKELLYVLFFVMSPYNMFLISPLYARIL